MDVFPRLVVLAFCIASSSALVMTTGSCPKVTTKRDFVLQKYLGLWFSYENFDVPYQIGLSCVTALYAPSYEFGTINVINSGRRRIKILDDYYDIGGSRAIGKAVVVDPENNPAGLKVSFGRNMPDFGGDEANYQILDTDFMTFSVVYSCFQLGALPLKVESAWILVRDPTQRPWNIDIIKRNMRGYGIDTHYFRRIDHSKCWASTGREHR